MTTERKDAKRSTNVVPLRPDAPEDCLLGLHSWTGRSGRLNPDIRCVHCGETYGHPD